jgi:hypothetical protein
MEVVEDNILVGLQAIEVQMVVVEVVVLEVVGKAVLVVKEVAAAQAV